MRLIGDDWIRQGGEPLAAGMMIDRGEEEEEREEEVDNGIWCPGGGRIKLSHLAQMPYNFEIPQRRQRPKNQEEPVFNYRRKRSRNGTKPPKQQPRSALTPFAHSLTLRRRTPPKLAPLLARN
ncbi:hypothetical protein AKJ16_DCAP08398 [Drosera capensis]